MIAPGASISTVKEGSSAIGLIIRVRIPARGSTGCWGVERGLLARRRAGRTQWWDGL